MNNKIDKRFAHLYTLSEHEVIELIMGYEVNKCSIKDLCKKFNLTKRVVTNYLKWNGVHIRDNQESHTMCVEDDIIKKIVLYYESGHTIDECANLVQLKVGKVYSILKKNTTMRKSSDKIFYLRKCSTQTKEKISKANKGHWVNVEQQIETKRKNNSFCISKPEQEMLNELKAQYGEDDVIYHYKESRYPYYCDFYIKSQDLFIELNAHWTHGGKPFDKNDKSCQEQLAQWKQKSKQSKFYKQAIYIWTDLDVRKTECARKNNLNYKVIY